MTGVKGDEREQDGPFGSHRLLGHAGASCSFPQALPGRTSLASGSKHQKGSMLPAFYQTHSPRNTIQANQNKTRLGYLVARDPVRGKEHPRRAPVLPPQQESGTQAMVERSAHFRTYQVAKVDC